MAGFLLSNFIGLAIIVGGLQFYDDASSLFTNDDSFVKSDFLVVNKKVTSASTWDKGSTDFSPSEIEDIRKQPWVRDVGKFSSADYRVMASVDQGGRGMSTLLFFESIPDDFVDVSGSAWNFSEGDGVVPLIISKDYLTLYNFGFASSAGLPQMSESIMSGIPLRLTLTSEDGLRRRELQGRVVGYSNRLNTILVPGTFMEWSNKALGGGTQKEASRLIIDVSSPGDIAINAYLEEHGLEVAGDKSGSSASYLLKVVVGIVLGIGTVITLLSFFILLLSMSLLMEKNRDKLHALLMLGCPVRSVASPYIIIVVTVSLLAYVLAVVCAEIMRHTYQGALEGLGATGGGWWLGPSVGLVLTLLLMGFNIISVRKRVVSAF
ncbi:MAG: ABC transporter permease [Muribaculaceae bacterium]|nr:ABC transporter permease [Muribaculaceae bacterium]MDE6753715.1 ABC transporter permease [Muribaculaceae bacterium]